MRMRNNGFKDCDIIDVLLQTRENLMNEFYHFRWMDNLNYKKAIKIINLVIYYI